MIGRRLGEDLVRDTDPAELIVLPPPVAQILTTDFRHVAELIDDALRAAVLVVDGSHGGGASAGGGGDGVDGGRGGGE